MYIKGLPYTRVHLHAHMHTPEHLTVRTHTSCMFNEKPPCTVCLSLTALSSTGAARVLSAAAWSAASRRANCVCITQLGKQSLAPIGL